MKKAIILALAVVFFFGTTAIAASESLVKKGHRGQEVREIQIALGVKPTGTFGKRTDKSVRVFQQRNNLRIDGIVGPQTRGVLFPTKTEDGSKPEPKVDTRKADRTASSDVTKTQVIRLQIGLEGLGFPSLRTGTLDPVTMKSYTAWQAASWWGVIDYRGRKGVITERQIVKIERQVEKAKTEAYHGSIRSFLARTTWYNKIENTHRWITKKLPNGKKTRVYVDTDPWTKKGLTFTGAPLIKAGADRVGSIAVDPKIIPYGSKVMLTTKDGPEFYVACDTGGAVVSRRAAKRSAKTPAQARAIVVDCFRDREPGTYLNIKVAPYKGAKPFRKLPRSEQMDHFNLEFAKAPFMRANLG